MCMVLSNEKKCLLQYFREEAGNDQKFAERVVKILAFNGIYTIDILMSKDDTFIYSIKGIGDRAMNLISRVKTKEAFAREKREEAYKKLQHNVNPITLKNWFEQTDMSYMAACKLEKILKKNGINTVDDFMKKSQAEIGSFSGIGPKYLQKCFEVKGMIETSRKAKK